MEQRNRDGIIIGMLVILTYFLIYAFLGNSSLLMSLGGLPLIDCTTDIIRNGFSAGAVAQLTEDFAQTIIVIYVVVFVENLIPGGDRRGLRGFAIMMLGYIFFYLLAMWLVRHIIFTSMMSDIVRMFVSIFFVVTGGLGALVASPLRRIISERMARNYLNDYLMNSRMVRWLADAFFIATVILFLAVAIEMTVGLPYFFTAFVAGVPALITLIIMVAIIYYLIIM